MPIIIIHGAVATVHARTVSIKYQNLHTCKNNYNYKLLLKLHETKKKFQINCSQCL